MRNYIQMWYADIFYHFDDGFGTVFDATQYFWARGEEELQTDVDGFLANPSITSHTTRFQGPQYLLLDKDTMLNLLLGNPTPGSLTSDTSPRDDPKIWPSSDGFKSVAAAKRGKSGSISLLTYCALLIQKFLDENSPREAKKCQAIAADLQAGKLTPSQALEQLALVTVPSGQAVVKR